MIKYVLYGILLLAVLGGGIGLYHLYKVKMTNRDEMARFEKEVQLQTDLGKVLVIYYSLSGHTKDIAEKIAAKTGGQLYQLKTVETYSSPSVYVKSKKELTDKNYPKLQNVDFPNFAEYDTIFVGGPVWWYTMAPALYSFLQQADFNQVRVAPFSTQGSNFGSFFTDFQNNVHHAQILPSESFNNMEEKYNDQLSNKINAWLNKLSQ